MRDRHGWRITPATVIFKHPSQGLQVRRMTAPAALLVMATLAPMPSSAQTTPRLGTISFPTSAGPAAQAAFEEGVLWMHSFEYAKAATAFQRAQQLEPDFALAYWGEAMTHNHAVWNQRDAAAAHAVLASLGPSAQARAAKALTPREQAWLATAEALWGEGTKARRDTLYAEALAQVVARFPDDEAITFHALALLGLNQGVRDVATYERAGAMAREVLKRSPNHPGAAHYVIHAYDDPDHAHQGHEAAIAYSRIAPDAPHAQHMTTHIFLALGMWDEVARQNVIAMQAATRGSDSLGWAPNHYTWWLHYARLQQGKWKDTQNWLRSQNERLGADASLERRRFLYQLADESQVTWMFFDQVPTHLRTEAMQGPTTILTRGLSAWQTRSSTGLQGEAAALEAMRRATPNDTIVALVAPQLHALVLEQHGELDSAIAVLRAAVAYEASLPMDFGPPAAVRPAHEALAELLLVSGRFAEAQVAFERALARTPGRSRALAGLVLAARGAKNSAAADAALAHLQRNFHAADAGALETLMASFDRRRPR
jgi:tetratricopeptide (TPR) repeat protein